MDHTITSLFHFLKKSQASLSSSAISHSTCSVVGFQFLPHPRYFPFKQPS
jgi:hypothetical protein